MKKTLVYLALLAVMVPSWISVDADHPATGEVVLGQNELLSMPSMVWYYDGSYYGFSERAKKEKIQWWMRIPPLPGRDRPAETIDGDRLPKCKL